MSATVYERAQVVAQRIRLMTQEEFQHEINCIMMKYKKCDPSTCDGECQGLGFCGTATSFLHGKETKDVGEK